MNPFSLEGKTALIVGASRGIGLAIARGMHAAGATVVLAARSKDKLEVLAKEMNGRYVEVDMMDNASIARAVEAAGDVDILVNVAGTNVRKRFEDITPEQYHTVVQTNLHSLAEITRLVGKRMIARGKGGKIINIGSLTTFTGIPYIAVYAMTKGAVGQLTKALAAEWAQFDIQVNCIAPGFILTDFNRAMWQPESMNEWRKGIQANDRMGTPEDIAPMAVFLASPGSDYVTGQVIAVDGGASTTMKWPMAAPPSTT